MAFSGYLEPSVSNSKYLCDERTEPYEATKSDGQLVKDLLAICFQIQACQVCKMCSLPKELKSSKQTFCLGGKWAGFPYLWWSATGKGRHGEKMQALVGAPNRTLVTLDSVEAPIKSNSGSSKLYNNTPRNLKLEKGAHGRLMILCDQVIR